MKPHLLRASAPRPRPYVQIGFPKAPKGQPQAQPPVILRATKRSTARKGKPNQQEQADG